MIRLLWDENASHDTLRALRRSRPDLDVVSIQEVGLAGAPDARVIDFAIAEGRVIVTGDRKTLIGEARQRIRDGAILPGVVVVDSHRLVPGRAATDLALIADVVEPEELVNQFQFLPL